MIDLTTPCQVWRDERGNAGALLASVAGVLLLGVEEGVILGVVLSLATLIWRPSRPWAVYRRHRPEPGIACPGAAGFSLPWPVAWEAAHAASIGAFTLSRDLPCDHPCSGEPDRRYC